jgi:hypothetical protein
MSLMKRVEVRVKAVKDLEGDASITMVRGTARYLFEFSAEIEWEAIVTEDSPDALIPGGGGDGDKKKKPKKFRGSIKLNEISSTIADGEDFEMERRFTKTPDKDNRAAVDEAVRRFEGDVNARIRSFVTEYRAR